MNVTKGPKQGELFYLSPLRAPRAGRPKPNSPKEPILLVSYEGRMDFISYPLNQLWDDPCHGYRGREEELALNRGRRHILRRDQDCSYRLPDYAPPGTP